MAEFTDIRVLFDDAPLRAVADVSSPKPSGTRLTPKSYLADLMAKRDVYPITDEAFVNASRLARVIDLLREVAFSKGYGFLQVNSAIRSRHYNDVILPQRGYKTAKGSYHVRGLAMDLSLARRGGGRAEIIGMLEEQIGNRNIPEGGILNYINSGFVHYDMRSVVGAPSVRQDA